VQRFNPVLYYCRFSALAKALTILKIPTWHDVGRRADLVLAVRPMKKPRHFGSG
jgi:hypothetical protein